MLNEVPNGAVAQVRDDVCPPSIIACDGVLQLQPEQRIGVSGRDDGAKGRVKVDGVRAYSGHPIDEEVDPLRRCPLLRVIKGLRRTPGTPPAPRVEEPIE